MDEKKTEIKQPVVQESGCESGACAL
jgi:hypothetical protein